MEQVKKRWINGRREQEIEQGYLLAAIFVQPVLLTLIFLAVGAVLSAVSTSFSGMLSFKSVIGFWLVIQAAILPAAALVWIAHIQQRLVKFSTTVSRSGYYPSALPIVQNLYVSPRNEYLLIGLGSRIALLAYSTVLIIGVTVYAYAIFADTQFYAALGDKFLLVCLGFGVLAGVGAGAMAPGVFFLVGPGIVIAVATYVVSTSGASLNAAVTFNQIEIVISEFVALASMAFAVYSLVKIRRLSASRIWRSFGGDVKAEEGVSHTSYYDFIAVTEGSLQSFAYNSGALQKTLHCISLATQKEELGGGGEQWEEMVGTVNRGQVLDSAEVRRRLQSVEAA